MESPLTRSEREALKAIYRLTHRAAGDAGDDGAHTGRPGRVARPLARDGHGHGEAARRPGLRRPQPVPGRRAHRHRAAGRGRLHPPPPHRRAVPVRHARLRVERGRPARRLDRARPARRRSRTGCSSPCTGRPPARTGSRSPSPRWPRSPRCRRSTRLEPGDVAVVAVPGSTDADGRRLPRHARAAPGRARRGAREAPVRRAARPAGRRQRPHRERAPRPADLRPQARPDR